MTRVERLSVNEPNCLLFVALLLVFDDYFLYHQEIEEIESSGRNSIGLFWLDMLVLVVWYALSLATRYSLSTFFFWVGCFFFSTSIWELVFSKAPLRKRLVEKTDVLVTAVAFLIAIIAAYVKIPYWIYVSIFLLGFFVWRWNNYKEIWTS